MINFVSTFPPLMCGIGTYTGYLVSKMAKENWSVTSFKLDELLRTGQPFQFNDRVAYEISLSDPHLPASNTKLHWFQHAFGIWGEESTAFLHLVKEAKSRKKKVIASLHTIHFESDETDSGMRRLEEDLLRDALPLLDVMTVFSDGAYRAVSRAFPQYKDKLVVLRHGAHVYTQVSQLEARESLLRYLINRADIAPDKKQELKQTYHHFFSKEMILLGNFGFIRTGKDPLKLYQLGQLVQHRLPNHRVVVLYAGRIQKRNDKRMEEYLPLLEELKSIHDGKVNLFIEDYLPEETYPLAFGALDFSVFWASDGTQSGRMAHAQGTGTCVVGRRIEGVGETLDLAGLPSAVSLEDLAEKITRLVLEPGLKQEVKRSSWHYAQEFSFERQAQKHILLAEAVLSGTRLPVLDRTKPVITFILDRLALAKRDGLEETPQDITAFLNVADDIDLYPPPRIYHKIPLKDGTPIPVERMLEAIALIQENIVSRKVLVFCRYGRGRSASVIIGYLCSTGLGYEDALRLVSSKKPDIYPLPELAETIRKALYAWQRGQKERRNGGSQ